jgi:DnaJ-domain-containing protein 1
MVGVIAVGLILVLLVIALLVYFWYITIPAIILIVVIYILRNRKPRIKKTSSCWETLPKQETSYDNSNSYKQGQERKYTRHVEKLERLQNAMLERFNLSEYEAELVFGERWKNILAIKNIHDEELAITVLDIQTKIMFVPDYRKKVIHIIDKLIPIIDSVIKDNPKTVKKYLKKQRGTDEEIYIQNWEFFKVYKKTIIEVNPGNELDKIESYNILELPETATIAQIKASFRRLAKKWHPDRNKANKTQAEQMFVKINRAYETILDNIIDLAPVNNL